MYKHIQPYFLSWKGHFSRITPKDVSMSTPRVGFGYSLSRTAILMSGESNKQPRTRFGVGAPRSKAGTVAVLESRPTINLDQVQIEIQPPPEIRVYENLDEGLAVEVRIKPNVVNLRDGGLQARILPTCQLFSRLNNRDQSMLCHFGFMFFCVSPGEGHANSRHQQVHN